MLRLVDNNTGSTVLSFDDNNEPIFGSEVLRDELFQGVRVPDGVEGFGGRVVFPATPDDQNGLMLFRRAMEDYYLVGSRSRDFHWEN